MKRLILLTILLVFLVGCTEKIQECATNEDCVPKACSHASECVPSDQQPDCSEMFCTMNCEPGTLDCGQGSCQCIEGVCKAVFN